MIFFDELDSIVPARGSGTETHVTERVVSQFLTELDGLEELKDVVVLAATNRPDLVDRSLLRPGRFDRLIYIPLPDKTSRKKIIKIHLSKMPISGDVTIKWLAEATDNYTGADIDALCREAGMLALREHIRPGMSKEELILDRIGVEKNHFKSALLRVKPHLSREMLDEYIKMIKDFEVL
jgi:transitional endoplasmic reticulum ATPase